MSFTWSGRDVRVAAMALVSAVTLLGAGLITAPGTAMADSGGPTLTMSAPARAATGSTVTIHGTLTGAVAGSLINVTAYDTLTGATTGRQPATDAAGDWKTTVRIKGDLQVTASAADGTSNQASARSPRSRRRR